GCGAACANERLGLAYGFGIEIVQHHSRAGARKLQCDGASDSTSCAGDKRGASLEGEGHERCITQPVKTRVSPGIQRIENCGTRAACPELRSPNGAPRN